MKLSLKMPVHRSKTKPKSEHESTTGCPSPNDPLAQYPHPNRRPHPKVQVPKYARLDNQIIAILQSKPFLKKSSSSFEEIKAQNQSFIAAFAQANNSSEAISIHGERRVADLVLQALKESKSDPDRKQVNEDMYLLAKVGGFKGEKVDVTNLQSNQEHPYAHYIIQAFKKIEKQGVDRPLAGLLIKQTNGIFTELLKIATNNQRHLILDVQYQLKNDPILKHSNKQAKLVALLGGITAGFTGMAIGASTHDTIAEKFAQSGLNGFAKAHGMNVSDLDFGEEKTNLEHTRVYAYSGLHSDNDLSARQDNPQNANAKFFLDTSSGTLFTQLDGKKVEVDSQGFIKQNGMVIDEVANPHTANDFKKVRIDMMSEKIYEPIPAKSPSEGNAPATSPSLQEINTKGEPIGEPIHAKVINTNIDQNPLTRDRANSGNNLYDQRGNRPGVLENAQEATPVGTLDNNITQTTIPIASGMAGVGAVAGAGLFFGIKNAMKSKANYKALTKANTNV